MRTFYRRPESNSPIQGVGLPKRLAAHRISSQLTATPVETLRHPTSNPTGPIFSDWNLNYKVRNWIIATPRNPSVPLSTDWGLNYPSRNWIPANLRNFSQTPHEPIGGTFYRRPGSKFPIPGICLSQLLTTHRNSPQPPATHRGHFLPTGT